MGRTAFASVAKIPSPSSVWPLSPGPAIVFVARISSTASAPVFRKLASAWVPIRYLKHGTSTPANGEAGPAYRLPTAQSYSGHSRTSAASFLQKTMSLQSGRWDLRRSSETRLGRLSSHLALVRRTREETVPQWTIPLVYAVTAVALGAIFPRIEAHWLSTFVAPVSIGSAVAIDSSIASGMMALT